MSHTRHRDHDRVTRRISRAAQAYLRKKRYLRRDIPARDFAHFLQSQPRSEP